MKILALDLGTSTGYAYNTDYKFYCGTWNLATDKEISAWGKQRTTRRKDPRIARFCEQLSGLPDFDVIVFEDVQFSTYTLQTQLWSSLRATVWLCGKAKLTECVPVATLKKFASGHGGATKEMMLKAAKRKFPNLEFNDLNDDAIDAFWLYQWAKTNLSRIKL